MKGNRASRLLVSQNIEIVLFKEQDFVSADKAVSEASGFENENTYFGSLMEKELLHPSLVALFPCFS